MRGRLGGEAVPGVVEALGAQHELVALGGGAAGGHEGGEPGLELGVGRPRVGVEGGEGAVEGHFGGGVGRRMA